MAEFVVELYLARQDADGLDLIYEATSLDAVHMAATKADLHFDRIIEAVGQQ